MKNFKEFIAEKEIVLSPSIDEYVVDDMGNGKFKVTLDNIERQFSVLPVPEKISEYENLFHELNNAINSKEPLAILKTIKKAESMPYDFGNLLSNSVSLNNVNGLAISLTEEQKRVLLVSEEDFIKTFFTTLPKQVRNDMMSYLYDISKSYAIVLEALFYYSRSGESQKFYQGKSFKDILDAYKKVIENKIPDARGPIDESGRDIDAPTDYAYWEFNYDGNKMFIRATCSPEILNSEENITGKKGLSVTLLDKDNHEVSKGTSTIPLEDFDKIFKRNK